MTKLINEMLKTKKCHGRKVKLTMVFFFYLFVLKKNCNQHDYIIQ